MTKPSYIPAPFRGPTLDVHMKMALQTSKSVFEARSQLERLLETSDVTILRDDGVLMALPKLWKLRLPDDGGIVLQTAGGDLDPSRVFISLRMHSVTIPREMIRIMTEASEVQQRALFRAGQEAQKKREQPQAEENAGTEPPAEATPASADAPAEPARQPQPVPEADPVRSRGGRIVEHDWEGAASYVEDRIKKTHHPLELNPKDGTPIIQRGIDLMAVWFKTDPKPPTERYIRDWINNHWERTSKWWNADN